MLDPKQQSEFDQAVAGVADAYIPILWALYRRSLDEGFREDQAMSIVITYLETMVLKE